MSMPDNEFVVGDSVRVKEGVNDPDSNTDISGWQGRILAFGEDQSGRPLVLIAWDSHTLKGMPESYVEQSEEENLNWQQFLLGVDDLEHAQSRDTQRDVDDIVEEIDARVRDAIPMMYAFDDILGYDTLLELAGERSFERGENYYYDGQVRDLIEHGGVIVAKVLGSYEYRVRFRAEEHGLSYSCDCPVGANGEFCKHCVAVGLAWLKGEAEHETFEEGTKPVTMEDVKAYLEGREKDALIGLLMEQVMEDERLRERLLLRAARLVGGSPNIAALRRAIDNAMEPPDDYYRDYDYYQDYDSRGNYAEQIDDVVRSIRELSEEGFAAQAIELCEYALATVEKNAMQYDVDGEIGDILENLEAIHRAACEKARPDPKALAARLFTWETRGDYDTFHGAAQKYAEVLGEEGLAEYRRLVEEEWEEQGYYDWRLTEIMRSLARASGDIEALVAIERKDLSSSRAYLRIAHIYHEADEPVQALAWAEEGVRAFPDEKYFELRDFLTERYHERGRHDEAMELAWARFTRSPNLEGYRRLKEHADRAGGWESWRQKALSSIREDIAHRKKEPVRSYYASPADHSELVRIFLWEGDVETAWREAKEGGCSNSLWMELAVRREEEHPEDALPIYRARIEPTIDQKNNQAYEDARELLVKVRKLMKRMGQEQQFEEYLDSIRTEHKRKRNLMKLLKSM